MKKTKYNIEYAHIYADEAFSVEQESAVSIVREFVSKIQPSKYVLTLLIDEYNPKYCTLDEKDYVRKLNQLGVGPDFLVRESNIASLWELFFTELSTREQRGVSKFIQRTSKLPCSFLIALWHLRRLGLIHPSVDIVERISGNRKKFEAEEVITVLPKRFAQVEARAIKYISSTRFRTSIPKIKHLFF